MSIKRTCKNCVLDGKCFDQLLYDPDSYWANCKDDNYYEFVPTEEIVRQDEREQIIKQLDKNIINANLFLTVNKPNKNNEYMKGFNEGMCLMLEAIKKEIKGD